MGMSAGTAHGAGFQLLEQNASGLGNAYAGSAAIRNAHYRLTSLPDKDRYWVSIGAQYALGKGTTIYVGYTHLFLRDADIENDTDPAAKGIVRGSYDSSANVIGVQVSHRY